MSPESGAAHKAKNLAGVRSEFAFTRDQRLLKGVQFKHVFAKSRRSSDRFFTVLARANDREHARLGLAIAKKRIRHAVGRNRIKRLVRESFRHHARDLGALDVIVLSRFDGNACRRELSESLAAHWQKLSRHRR